MPEEDGDRLYSPLSRALLRRLWKGDASSRMLHPRLQKAMGAYLRANKHGVRFRGRRAAGRSRAELLCALRGRVRVRTLDGTEPPFSALGWRTLVPAVPLGQLLPRGLRSCAVVTSAGAILNSSLGEEIGGSRGYRLVLSASPAQCSEHPSTVPPLPGGPGVSREFEVTFLLWDRMSLVGIPAEVSFGAI